MLASDKMLITGSSGFLGTALTEKLIEENYQNLTKISSKDYDLTKEIEVNRLFNTLGPFDLIFHLAANNGGLGYLKENSGKVIYENSLMNLHMLEYAKRNDVKKFIALGSALSYPENTELPFKEKDILNGRLEEGSISYTFSKDLLLVQSKLYRQQFNFNSIYLVMSSMYGPMLKPTQSVISLIKRIHDAKLKNKESITAWGTGNATRDWLFIDDAVEGILLAAKKYNESNPLNIGSGRETRVESLVKTIAEKLSYTGRIIWDPTKPEGPKRMLLDLSTTERLIGYKPKIDISTGLDKTIEWYFSH